jgi:sortase (surface protein transpeptidase)
VSTLNEIAANHARMAKAKEEESTGLSERQLHVVGSIEIQSVDAQQHVPLHLMAGTQDNNLGQAISYSL